MKTGHLFAKLAVLFSCSMAFAVNGSQFYNLAVKSTTSGVGPAAQTTRTLYLYQATTACTAGQVYGEGNCVASVKDTPQELANLLQKNWIDKKDYNNADLFLRSDIDLGEMSARTPAGKCDVNHVALPSPKSVKIYASNGSATRYTVKNLCYVSTSPMTAPFGLFSSLNEVNMADFSMKGVRIIVGGSTNGADYYPVGGLAGEAALTTIENPVMEDVEIDAPFAGSVVGLLKSSTVKKATFNDDIFVSNSTSIETGFAGSNSIEKITDHKIFIGGVVGAAIRSERDDASFDAINVTVNVKNLAKNQESAVGGVAGLYSTTGETITGVKVSRKIKYEQSAGGWGWGYTAPSTPIDTIESVISGGSSMGGLFGVMTVYHENNSPVRGNFTMKNSSFEGIITGASVSSTDQTVGIMAVGGLIGYDSLMAGMSVTISGSSANAVLVDSVRSAGNYHYYAGGLVGYGGAGACRNGTQEPTDFISFVNSKTSGSIDLSAAPKTSGESLHMQSFVGGIVGAACLSSGTGLKENSSSMKISVKSRTFVDEKYVSNGAYLYDSLFVGGLAGYFNTGVAIPAALSISKSTFGGSISVDDSLSISYVGGIVGSMMQRVNHSQGGNGHAVEFSGVKAEAASGKLIDYKVNAPSKPSVSPLIANIGGICGLCDELYTLELSNVRGSIEVSGNFAGDSLLVGGLIGKAYASGVPYVHIQKAFVDGDVIVPDMPEQTKVGFLVGSSNFNTNYNVKSAYHYGASDKTVTKPFGSLLYRGNEGSNDWMTDVSVSYVVRNAETENMNAIQFNGTKTLSQMQNDEFLTFLKTPFSTEKNPGWNKVIGKYNDLPYVEGENLGCAVGVLTVNFVNANNDLVVPPMCVASGTIISAVDTALVAPLESKHCSGWEIQESPTTRVDFDASQPITKNLTIYAKYSMNSYKVVFRKSADTTSTILAGPFTVEHGGEIGFPAEVGSNADSIGYHFVGWNDSASVKNVVRDLNIFAIYNPNVTIYTYLDKDGNFFVADTVYANDPRPERTAPEINYDNEKFKYEFDGWYAVESDEFPGNVFKAQYVENLIDYYISFVTMDGDTIEIDTLNYGDEIKYPSYPEKDGMKFVKWEPKSITVTRTESIIAYYEPVVSAPDTVIVADTSKPSKATLADTAFQSTGNAFKVKYGVKDLDTTAVTTAKLVVRKGNEVVLDSVLAEDVMDSFNAEWVKLFAAAGNYTIQVIVENGNWVDSSYKQSYTVDSIYTVAAKNWQMVALSALETEADGWSRSGFLYWWDESTPIGEYWQYRTFRGGDVDPTRGYWFGASKGNTLTIRPAAEQNVEDIVWNLDNIYSGWNMVANPYGWAIDLTKADDNGAGVTYYQWLPDAGTYAVATSIGPYEAVWAKLEKGSSAKVIVPANPFYEANKEDVSVGKKAAALRKSLRKVSSKGWSVMATLSDGNGRTDFMNVIGAGDKDDSVGEPPAGMGDHVNLSVMDGKKALAKSVKTVADEYEWIFSVAASSARDGKLSFDGVEDLNAQGLHLYVTVDGVTSEVKAGEAVAVALAKTSKNVGVRVAASTKAEVAAKQISGFRAVQSAGELQMQFDASNDLAGASVHYALVGVNGKRISSGSFTANGGSNSLAVSAPKAGVYFMQLKVGSQMSSAKVLVK